MRQLYPDRHENIDVTAAYEPVAGTAVRLGMVMSVDGSVTDAEGWTDHLGGAADRQVFHALRATADAILVGSITAHDSRCRPHRPSPDVVARRVAAGQAPVAPVVVVSRSLDLAPTLPIFAMARTETLILTSQAALQRRTDLPATMEKSVIVAGTDDVDLRLGMRRLHERGLNLVLCEGGPTLAAALLDDGLLDEIFLNIAPKIVPGSAHTALFRGLTVGADSTLINVHEQDGVLFLRYGVATTHD